MNLQDLSRKATIMLAILLLLGGPSAWAQVGQASFRGTVTDPQGSAIPGAVVTATHQETGRARSAVTSATGDYRISGLPVGLYTLNVELSGFQAVTLPDLQLSIGQEAQMDVKLGLSSIEESITVTGTLTPIVDVRRSEVTANVSELQLDSLPVKTRAWLDIATILPQAHQDAIRAQYYNSVNIGSGVIFYTNGFYIDGANNNWQEQGEPRQDFPADAIAEFKVYTANARAELGWSQGGYMAIVTKSGTNDYHGSSYWYFRDKALNSQTTFEENTEKGDFRRHQYGGSIGGPVIEDKAHFFASFEYTTQDESFTVNTGGVFPEEEGTFPRPGWNRMFLGRYDHSINENQHLFVRYAEQTNERGFLRSGGRISQSAGHTFGVPRDSVVAGHTWSIGTDMLNEFRFMYAKSTFQGWPAISDPFTQQGEFPQERIDSIPLIINRPSIRLGQGGMFLGPEPHWQYRNDFTKYTDKHEVKFGTSLEWIRYSPDNAGNNGQFNFDTDADFNQNDPSTHPFLFTQSFPSFYDIPNQEFSFYVDDTWSVSPNLTLNLGLRYDIQREVWNENLLTDSLPEIRVPIFRQERVIQEAGVPPASDYPYFDASTRGDKNNFGPRVGAVWNPGGEGRQSLRAAYGVYYQRYRSCPAKTERSPNIPRVRIINPDYPDPYVNLSPEELFAFSSNLRTNSNVARNPYAHQAAVGYTRELGPYTSIDIDFTLSEAYNQHTEQDANYWATPRDLAAGNPRLNENFGQVRERLTSEGRLSYRAVGVKLERRFSNDLQFLTSYSWAWVQHDRDGVPRNQFTRDDMYGFVFSDRRHRLKISSIYRLPAGFQVSGFMRYASDRPLDVNAGTDITGDGQTNHVPGTTYNQGCRGINLDAVNAYRGGLGQSSVSSIECPDLLTLDMVLLKEFAISGSTRIEAMVQVFNVFNKTNLDLANGDTRSPSFGQVLRAAGDARQIEFAFRVKF
jgi:hypothetical protein